MSRTLDRIEKAMTTLVLDSPFFASLALRLKVAESDTVPTFSTDGKRMLVNPKYCAERDDGEVVTICCEEALHNGLGHSWRMPVGADHKLWNAAADMEIYGIFHEANESAKTAHKPMPFKIPADSCYDPKYAGWAAEAIYGELMKRQDKGGSGNKPSPGEVMSPPPANQADKDQLKEEWDRAMVQAAQVAQGRGTLPGSLRAKILKLIRPRIDWRQVLRDFCREKASEDYSFARVNMRYIGTGFYLPTLHSERMGVIVFGIDTSGSIYSRPELLREFIGQCQLVLDELLPEKITVLCCDTKITRQDEYQVGDHVADDAPGGGGTDFTDVFSTIDKMDEPPACAIYLTDMEGTYPQVAPDYPTLWIQFGNSTTKAPFGETVQVAE